MRRRAALRAPRLDRADRVVGEVAPVPQEAGRGGARRGRAGPDHHPDRAARRSPARSRRPSPSSVAADLLLRFAARASRRAPSTSADAAEATPVTIYRGDGAGHPGVAVRRRRAAGRVRRRDRGDRRRDRRPRGRSPRSAAAHPDDEVVDLTGGVVLPGLVDTHVHFPQVRVIGGARHAAAGLAGALRAARGGPAGRRRLRARGGRASSSTGCCAPARRPRWSSGRTSPPRSTACSSARPRPGLRISQRAGGQRPAAAPGAADHPGAGARRTAWRWPGAGTARTGCATPSPPASRSRPATRCWSRARRCCGTSTARCSPRTSTRTPRRSTPCAGCSPSATRLPGHLRPVRAARAAQRAGAQRAPRRRRAGPAGRGRRERGALPVEQQRAGQRPVPAAPARRARRAGGAGHRRRRRHQLLAAPRGPAGLLHAGPARRRRAAADAGAPAVPGHRGPAPRRWTWTTRSATCRWASSSTRCGSAPMPAAPSTSCSRTPPTPTTRWPRCSRWPGRRTCGGVGRAAIGCADGRVRPGPVRRRRRRVGRGCAAPPDPVTSRRTCGTAPKLGGAGLGVRPPGRGVRRTAGRRRRAGARNGLEVAGGRRGRAPPRPGGCAGCRAG